MYHMCIPPYSAMKLSHFAINDDKIPKMQRMRLRLIYGATNKHKCRQLCDRFVKMQIFLIFCDYNIV